MTIGQNIKNLRKKHGLTQAQLGEKVGTRQKVIADYENSLSKPPRDRLFALANFFNIPVEKLIGNNINFETDQITSAPKIHGNKRVIKLQDMFEQLNPADQRAILKHASALLKQSKEAHQ